MPRCRGLGGMNSDSRLRPKSAESYGLSGGWTSIAGPHANRIGWQSWMFPKSQRRPGVKRNGPGLENRIEGTQGASSIAPSPSLLLYRSGQSNCGPQNPGSKRSPVRKKREKLTNLFLARLMSVFGDLKSLRVLNAGRLCAIPFL